MNGAQSLVHTLLKSGVNTCFANPGTSEMHFVAALDQIPGMRCVLGLQENGATGMADGYFRIAGTPACTLLHCGPGLANGLANLHNARRARSAIVNIVGDHATFHRPFDSPLTADTEALARTVSGWTRTSGQAAEVGRDAAAAVQAALHHPGQVATLILPSDASWNEGGVVADALPRPSPLPIDPSLIEIAAGVLGSRRKVLLLLGGNALDAATQLLAWRIAQHTGAAVMAEYVAPKVARGRGRPALERIPYDTSRAIEVLQRFDDIVLVGSTPPISFFANPALPSRLYAAHTQIHLLSRPDQDCTAALQDLAQALRAPICAPAEGDPPPSVASGAPSPEGLAQTLAALMPDNSIVSDESVSYGRGFYRHTHTAPPHDWLHLTGGAIGDGIPVATGAAIAAAGQRRVIGLQADGSAMYSLQALWTQARERLPVTTIILANRRYNILIGEYKNVGATAGPTAMNMLDLGNPTLDWVALANGMGVEAAQASTMEACADLMKASFSRPEPFVIELLV